MKDKRIGISELIFALLSGALTALAFPKFKLIFFAWISLIPLLKMLPGKRPGQGFKLGLLSGFAFYAVLLYWIPAVPMHYGNMSLGISILVYIMLALVLALFWGLFGWITCLVGKKLFTGEIYLLIPFFWITSEFLVTKALTGFPWGVLGYSQQPNLYLIQMASVTGVYGISFLLILFQCMFLLSMRIKKRSPFFSILALILLIHMAGFLTVRNIKEETGENTFKASVIQGNISSDIYWPNLSDEEKRGLLEEHLQLSQECVDEGSRLIVWPEFSLPLCFSCPYGLYLDFRKSLEEFVSRTDSTLVLGTNEIGSDGENTLYFNSSLTLRPDSSFTQYNKMHLVPFGEYTPYKKVFFFIDRLTHSIGEVTSGREHILHSYRGIPFGTPICYEIIFPNLVRKFTQKGAQFLATITNDGWYGRSAAPYQHFSIAVLRAVENRRYLLRAATTGISGFIDPYGRIITSSALDTQTHLTASISPKHKKTLYTRLGDWLPYLSLTLTLLFLILAFLKRKNNNDR